jgi:hypothetical protein
VGTFNNEVDMTDPISNGRKPDGTFGAGNNANPTGRPKGSRQKLQTSFLDSLAADFDENGVQAICEMREKDPSGYVKTVASLMPKQLEIERPLQGLSDDELVGAIDALRSYVAAQQVGAGDGGAGVGKPAGVVQAVH